MNAIVFEKIVSTQLRCQPLKRFLAEKKFLVVFQMKEKLPSVTFFTSDSRKTRWLEMSDLQLNVTGPETERIVLSNLLSV